MLEIVLDNHILFVLMGIMTGLGILSKMIVNVTLKRLVYASGNMSKSNHPLMRLVRAKFEHTCMISDKVENVPVFVDKYLYEYRVAGMKLHSWRRMEKAAAGLCLLLGVLGAALWYVHLGGMQDMVLKTGAAGAGLAIFIFLFHLTTDESFRMEAVHNYMVDYLENVCMHKYEKEKQKELKVMAPEAPIPEFGAVPERALYKDKEVREPIRQEAAGQEPARQEPTRQEPARPEPVQEVPAPPQGPEIEPPVKREGYQEPGNREQIQAITAKRTPERAEPLTWAQSAPEVEPAAALAGMPEAKPAAEEGNALKAERKKEEPLAKDVLIRQILEEFMA